jgi:hypothetical protein
MKLRIALALLFVIAQQTTQQLSAGRIEGMVLRAETGEPLSRARVTLLRVNPGTGVVIPSTGASGGGGIGAIPNAPLPPLPGTGSGPFGPAAVPPPGPPPQPPIPAVTTDRDGKFVVPNLAEGSYRVAVVLDGYVRQEYGQRLLTGQGTPLKLAEGEVLRDIVVRLTPTAAINGRITTPDGRPAANVPVQLIRAGYGQNGQRNLQITTRATSNDRGEYRLFWITPGRYYLAAGSPLGERIPLPSDSHVLTYYPGTTDVGRALPLDVKPGSEGFFDLVAPKQEPYKISGRIVDASSLSPSAVGLSLAFPTFSGGGAGYLVYSQAYDSRTGSFELRDIPPGNYVVQVNTGTATARVPVEVTNADIEGLTIVVANGVSINGLVRVEGDGPPPQGGTRIQLRPVLPGTPSFVGFAPQAQAAADGTFRLDNVLSGTYRAVITPPGDSFVKEARLDRSDALNSLVEVSESRLAAPMLEIVLSTNVAEIDGLVTDAQLQRAPGIQAVLVPDSNRDRTDLFRTATSDQSGRFSMRRIAPGDYHLFAWETLEPNAYYDPDLLKRFLPLGTELHIEESSRLSPEIRLIPAEAR